MTDKNRVRQIREKIMMSKAELARKAGVSWHLINRIEKGLGCRMASKRKILFALGFTIDEKDKVFPQG